jgi:hypothetical protein
MNKILLVLIIGLALVLNIVNAFETNKELPIQITSANLSKADVKVGDTLTVTVEVRAAVGIKEIVADMGGIENITLQHMAGNLYQGTWQKDWLVHSTEVKNYTVTLFVRDNTGNELIDRNLKFTDPVLFEYYNTGYDIYPQLFGVTWRAQTFTTTSYHSITSVKLFLERVGSPGTVTVSIRATDGNGHPTGGDLTSGTTDGNTLCQAAPCWREIPLTEYALSPNTKYAIVVRISDGGTLKAIYWYADGSSPTYTGGNGEITYDYGASWTTWAYDHMFEIWGNSLNTAPTLTSILESTDPIEKGTTQTITPSGQGDAESNNLYIYCCQDTSNTCTPTTSNICNNNQVWSSPYSSMTCTLTAPSVSTATTYYARCRVYDGSLYSSATASTSYIVKLSNGNTCTASSDCISGNCKSDYDGVGAWCANSNQCAHDGAIYNSGTYSSGCYDSNNRAYCNAGTWTASDCRTSDSCSKPTTSCTANKYYCLSGSCTYTTTSGTDVCSGSSQINPYYTCSDTNGNAIADTCSSGFQNCGAGTVCVSGSCVGGTTTTTSTSTTSTIETTTTTIPTTTTMETTTTSSTTTTIPTLSLSFKKGWNLFSIPYTTIQASDSCGVLSATFYYWSTSANKWEKVIGINNIKNAKGYWFYSDSDCSVGISGLGQTSSNEIKLYTGWNTIGSPSDPVSDINTVSTACSITEKYYYETETKQWREATSLEPFIGYYIYSSNNCQFSS